MVTLSAPVDTNLRRLRNEFMAMPGLCLTARQAARLVSVRESKARALLDALVAEGLLVCQISGLYRRAPR